MNPDDARERYRREDARDARQERWITAIPIIVVAAIVVPFAIFYSCNPPHAGREHRIDGVRRVMMHDSCRFDFLKGERGDMALVEVRFDAPPRFRADVPPGRPMFVTYRERITPGQLDHSRLATQGVVHLHSPQDLDGGEWDYGKFGRGRTIPVE